MKIIELFELAGMKGYEFQTIWYEDTEDSDYLQLCQIQKWLRDNHNYSVEVVYRSVDKIFFAYVYPMYPRTEVHFTGKQFEKHEDALLCGIEKALNLLA